VLATASGSIAPLVSLALPLDFRVFARPGFRSCPRARPNSSHELPPSFRVRRSTSGRCPLRDRGRSGAIGSSREVSPPTASPRPGQRHEKVTELPALDRPPPTGFLNLVASSSAPDLLALFHARSAPGVRPSELCSFRAAARRLRRRCPPVVGVILRSARAAGGRRERRNAAPNPPPSHVDGPSKRPSPSGLCSTRKSATSHRLFRPTRSAWLSWDSSPPGFSPSSDGRDLHRASPHEIPCSGASVLAGASPGYCYPTRLAHLSRDCRPSWGSATS
jgi:hypothetical protein